MDVAVMQSHAASAFAGPTKASSQPVNRESRDATAKHTVKEDAVEVRGQTSIPTSDVELADLSSAQGASSDVADSISAQPGLALGAQAQVSTEAALALLR